ncbi:MAG: VCBS repeat-containing protein [Saprospiraceae bacterium]|nr:VCBS repeat-containing protein [Saprospiraceae bacterium]
MIKYIGYLLVFSIVIIGCSEDNADSRVYPDDTSKVQFLEEIPSSVSGITFNNRIKEDPAINVITFDGMLQGAGVAVLDADNDGLMDIYFASNMEGDKLYRNKGDFKFEDVSAKSGINPMNWSTGVAVVDINNDGFDDIYVCKFLYDDASKRENVFYINNGDGTFTNKAKEMGLNDNGYGIMANFFDYDNDGDLDVYLANQPPNSLAEKTRLKGKVDYSFTDRLYKNNNGKFVDVTDFSGITNYAYSLSATAFDFNQDGLTDIYVACDYDEPDILYKNNGNGTFKNITDSSLKHMSNFSMGVDIADINNDGHLDVYVADMVAEDNYRQKTNMSGMNPEKFFALARNGYHYQYMFNAMQLNNGDETFSEIAQLSGISNTDWSWSPLFVDFDQDGLKDLVVTNGLIKEMRNKDFQIWRKKLFEERKKKAKNPNQKNLGIDPLEISKKAPTQKIANFIYKNEGGLNFSKQTNTWGLGTPTWSQGAAYADFDNDGDLDMIINNMSMEASLYKNTANEKLINNYLSINLEGSPNNKKGINARIEVSAGGSTQAIEMTPYRGYMSSCQTMVHFGLGKDKSVDQLKVIWPDNKVTDLSDIKANQTLVVKYSEASSGNNKKSGSKGIFRALPNNNLVHIENEYNDYKREILLPYKTSTLGPIMAQGDVNNDGFTDIYLGGSAGNKAQLLAGINDKQFQSINAFPAIDAGFEDGGAVFFDFDNDNDLDLYVCSGGSEYKEGTTGYLDRLYINNGKGAFTKSNLLPNIKVSTSTVVPFDYDGDGDLDLFVGGRQQPGKYGRKVNSFLLENNGERYVDVTKVKAPFFENYGMVTDGKVADINGDGKLELITVGEWMPIQIYSSSKDGLKEITENFNLKNTKGWWNAIEIADVDGDNDLDIIAGNLGHNIKYKASVDKPFKLFVDDFDKNGSNDVYLGYYEGDKCYPVRGRQCSSQQMPFVSDKFKSYSDFGSAEITDVLDGLITDQTVLQEAQTFSNSIFINKGKSFEQVVLPGEAQISPVYGIAVDDFDKDGKTDIFLAGNMYNREVETTRSDAGKGCLVTMDDSGNFVVSRNEKTGVSADKDVRDVALIKSKNQSLLVIANNNDAMQIYTY